MTLYEAIGFIAKHGNQYAKAYANQAMMQWNTEDDEGFRTQMLYIKSNISHLRAPDAKDARAAIDEFLKG